MTADPVAALFALALALSGGGVVMAYDLPRRAVSVYLTLPRRVAQLEADVAAIRAESQAAGRLLADIHQAVVPSPSLPAPAPGAVPPQRPPGAGGGGGGAGGPGLREDDDQ